MLNKMSNAEIIILLEKKMKEHGLEVNLGFNGSSPEILNYPEDNNNGAILGNVKEITNTYTIVKVGESEIILEKLNMVRNRIIELFDLPTKEILYNAINEGKRVRYTTHRRGIPTKSFIYDTDKEYKEIVIEPNEYILAYTDFDLLPLDKLFLQKGVSEELLVGYKDFLNMNGFKVFKQEFEEELGGLGITSQYPIEEIIKFLQRL